MGSKSSKDRRKPQQAVANGACMQSKSLNQGPLTTTCKPFPLFKNENNTTQGTAVEKQGAKNAAAPLSRDEAPVQGSALLAQPLDNDASEWQEVHEHITAIAKLVGKGHAQPETFERELLLAIQFLKMCADKMAAGEDGKEE